MKRHLGDNPLSIFVSYSIKDKELAGNLKKCFEEYFGLKVFLAHEDISPSAEWDPAIVGALKNTDLVTLLVSKNSECSPFVNQEIGMALAWKKKIIPVKVDKTINPPGFINKIQACNCGFRGSGEIDILETCTTIFFIFATHDEFSYEKYQKRAVDSVISALSESKSFSTSITASNTLKKLNERNILTKKQLDKIKEIAHNNDQVYNSFIALPLIEAIIKN